MPDRQGDLTGGATQRYCCVVPIPGFRSDGTLPPGIHWATWPEIEDVLGGTPHRDRLLLGLRAALRELKASGCRTAYVDGSFASGERVPNDFDACWDWTGVDPTLLDPVLLQFDNGRAAQKTKYLGEFFPAQTIEGSTGAVFLEFFQTDKNTGDPKGIIAVDLRGLL